MPESAFGFRLLTALPWIVPIALAAQSPADSTVDSLPTDSLQLDTPSYPEDGDSGLAEVDDSVVEGHRGAVRRRGEGNPFLREVDPRFDTHRKGGVFATVAIGAGSEAISALGPTQFYGQSRIRPTLSGGIGVNATREIRVGLDLFGWFNIDHDGQLETVGAVLAAGRIYPAPSLGLYLRAGAGFGLYDVSSYDGYCDCTYHSQSDYGLAWLVGGGFEAPVSRSLAIGPMVEMVRFNVTGPGGYRERVVNVGVSFTVASH